MIHRSESHSGIAYQNYLAIHDRGIEEFLGHFIVENSISVYHPSRSLIRLSGRVLFMDELFLDVTEQLIRNPFTDTVRLVKYRYHAGKRAPIRRDIFRYDNAHGGDPEFGHPDEHHKHIYDIATGQPRFPPEWVGADHLPSLRDILTELQRWWEETGSQIDWNALDPLDHPGPSAPYL